MLSISSPVCGILGVVSRGAAGPFRPKSQPSTCIQPIQHKAELLRLTLSSANCIGMGGDPRKDHAGYATVIFRSQSALPRVNGFDRNWIVTDFRYEFWKTRLAQVPTFGWYSCQAIWGRESSFNNHFQLCQFPGYLNQPPSSKYNMAFPRPEAPTRPGSSAYRHHQRPP
jgi:hypothetical protein